MDDTIISIPRLIISRFPLCLLRVIFGKENPLCWIFFCVI